MKYTIHGFSQQKALDFQLSNDDLLILRWIIDFCQSGKMKTVYLDGKMYYWINYQFLLGDIPILNIKKDTLYRKLKRLSEIGILDRTTVTENGTYSYYGIGEKYGELISGEYSERAYDKDYSEGTEKKPRESEKNPTPTKKNPRGSTEKNPTPTEKNPEQRPYILNPSTNQNQSTISNISSKPKKVPTSGKVDTKTLMEQFNLLWSLYPKGRKQGKDMARKSFLKAIKDGVTFEEIKNALIAYNNQIKNNRTDTKYIKMGSTWFNQKCWEDEYEGNNSNAYPDYSYGVEGVDHL